MGKDLRAFKEFTANMDPVSRGDAIDNFEFAKSVHNSFARENDLLQADMCTKYKVDQARKKEATAKARATREEKKAALLERSPNITSNEPSRSRETTARTMSLSAHSSDIASNGGQLCRGSVKSDDASDGTFKPGTKVNGEDQGKEQLELRRTSRAPKPRKTAPSNITDTDDHDEGFHFIAYMPVDDHVWKLDGLDKFPHSLGKFDRPVDRIDDSTSNWIHVAQPAIVGRMAQFEGAEIEFNLMAVVHDPMITERDALIGNLKTLLFIDKKLDQIDADWRSMDGAETKREVMTSESSEFGISQADIENAEIPAEWFPYLSAPDDLLKLVELRKRVIGRQNALRAGLRDSLASWKDDDEKARHRRHDYGTFLRSWLNALVDEDLLGDLLVG